MLYEQQIESVPWSPAEGGKGVDGADFFSYLCYVLGCVQIWVSSSYPGVDTCATGVKQLNLEMWADAEGLTGCVNRA